MQVSLGSHSLLLGIHGGQSQPETSYNIAIAPETLSAKLKGIYMFSFLRMTYYYYFYYWLNQKDKLQSFITSFPPDKACMGVTKGEEEHG